MIIMIIVHHRTVASPACPLNLNRRKSVLHDLTSRTRCSMLVMLLPFSSFST